MVDSTEYLRGYRDAMNVVIARVRADPLMPQGSSAALSYAYAVDTEASELLQTNKDYRQSVELERRATEAATKNYLKSVEKKLSTALREIARLNKRKGESP